MVVADDSTLSGAFAASPNPILAFDPTSGHVVDANEAALSLVGTDREQLLDAGADRFLARTGDAAGSVVADAVRSAPEDGTSERWVVDPADGETTTATVALKASRAGGEAVVFAFLAPFRPSEDADESRRVLEDLHDVSTDDAPTEETLDRMLRIAREFLGMEFAYLTRFEDGSQRVVRALGDHDELSPGAEAPLSETYCQWTLEAGDPDGECAIPDADAAGIRDHPAHERFGFDAYLGRTVVVDGEVRGTVCFSDSAPREDGFSTVDRMVVDVVAGWIGTELADRERRETLRRRQRQLRAVFDTPASFIGLLDPDGALVRANSTAWELVEADPEEFVGEPFWAGPWWSHDESLQAEVREAVATARDGDSVEFEAEHPTPDGDSIVAEVTFRPIVGEDGTVESIVAHGVDVTDLKDRERRLGAQNRRLRALVENAPIILFSLAPDGEFRQSMGRALESMGLEEGEVVGQNVFDLFGDDVAGYLREALGGEEVVYEAEVGGTAFRTWLQPVFDEYGGLDRVIGVSVDVTDKHRQERRLRAVNEATDQLAYATTPAKVAETVVDISEDTLEESIAAVWTLEDGVLEPVAATDSVATLPGVTTASDLSRIEPGDREMDVFESGETAVFEEYAALEDSAASGPSLGTVLFAPLGDHGMVAVGSSEVGPIPEMERTLVEILVRNAAAAMDRAQREAELAEYRTKLEQSNRNLQEFAYVASHDLQEPLRMVSSYVDLLAMEYEGELDDEADDYIEFAVDGAERMQSMIDALLDYSRVHTHGGDFERTDAAEVVADVERSLELLLDETGTDLRVGSLPTVRADPDQLGQVFQNLIENAVEHGDGVVEVSATEREDAYEFAVADDGEGVPESQQERIFEIFKQGNDSDGTGIGLAVCERIVQRHEGEIWVESDPPKGSTFRFTIPKRGPEEHPDHV